MTITEETLVYFLETNLGVKKHDVRPDTVLFSSGFIDSFNMINLIMFLEEQCQSRIKPSEITLDNLDSIERILDFLRRRDP